MEGDEACQSKRTSSKAVQTKVRDYLKNRDCYHEDNGTNSLIVKNDPNVIHLFEALEDPESKKVYLVMEFAKYGSICSELYWRRREKEYFAQNKSGRCTFKRHHSLKEILDIFAQLCRGLAYCIAYLTTVSA